MRGKNHSCGWLAMFLIASTGLGWAHDPGLSTAALKTFPGHFEGEATFARADIERLVHLDANRDGTVSSEELERARPTLEALTRNVFKVPGVDAIVNTEPAFRLDENDNFHMVWIFRAPGPKLIVESPLIKRLPRGHRQFIRVLDDQGATLTEALLTAEHDAVEFGGRASEEVQTARTSTFGEFFFMGVEHILSGYDHLIFLLGLLIVSSQFRATLWTITCFTLAHSTTLALAAFDVVRIPAHIVEWLIAATIIYVGTENLLRGNNATGRWKLTLTFGLVHGLGFATDLKEKVAGMVDEKIVFPLVSFNLGVELGQMAIASLVLPMIWWFRNEPVVIRVMVPACSVVVIVAGAWWLLERTLLS
jgi:hydrogenase/urease accessory protein HupE